MTLLDARPSRFDILAPPSGGLDRRVLHEGVDLTGEQWRWVVQPWADTTPNLEEPLIEATFTPGDGESQLVFADAEVAKLTVATQYRLFVVRDGVTVAAGSFTRSKNQTESAQEMVVLAVDDQTFTLTILGGSSGAPIGLPIDISDVNNLEAALAGLAADIAAVDAASIAVQLMHFTPLPNPTTQPHPFGEFIPEGAVIELLGQSDPAELGTYRAPADAATAPLVKVDDILVSANVGKGKQVVVNRVIQGPFVYGPLELMIGRTNLGVVQFEPQSGVTMFAQAEWDFDDTANDSPVDFSGAVQPGWIVFGVGATGGPDASGFFQFVADGEPMVRYRVQPSVGTTVRVMSNGKVWILTPHSGWIDRTPRLAAQTITADEVQHQGTGLLGFTGNVASNVDALEGIVDRWQFVAAFATSNVDLTGLVGAGPVAVQPALDGGAIPVPLSDVRLFGQSDPAENGAYLVGSDGAWIKYAHPDVFDPPGNGFRVTCNAPGTPVHGVTFVYIDDDRLKSRRAGSSSLSEPSPSGAWLRLPTPTADLDTAPEAAKLDASSPRVPPTPVGATDGHVLTVEDDEYVLAAPTGWQVVHDEVFATDVATRNVDLPTGCTAVRIRFAGRSTRASTVDTLRLRFNNDSSDIYSPDSASLTNALSLGNIPGAQTNTNRHQIVNADLEVAAGFTKVGTVRRTGIGSTATVGQAVGLIGMFSTMTAAVTSMQFFCTNADIAAGSRLTVECLPS